MHRLCGRKKKAINFIYIKHTPLSLPWNSILMNLLILSMSQYIEVQQKKVWSLIDKK